METYWRAVLESLHDEIIIVGRDMRLKWANKAVRERWDEGRNGPVAGLPCHVVNHGGKPCAASECPCPVREVLSSGRAATALHVHPAGDGTKRYVEIVASPLQCGNGPVEEVVEVMHDVTAQQRAQQSLRRRNEELSAMYRVTLAVGSSLDLDEVLQMALQTVVEVTHMDAGAIYLRQENDALMLRAYLNLSAETTRTARILRLNESACGQVSARGWPLITHGDEEADRPLWEPLRRSGLRTLIHIPLKANR
ncbi:MAG: GAF domain-containing protein, partial [Anaerolineae bacterium]